MMAIVGRNATEKAIVQSLWGLISHHLGRCDVQRQKDAVEAELSLAECKWRKVIPRLQSSAAGEFGVFCTIA